jgi:hypothetical protein
MHTLPPPDTAVDRYAAIYDGFAQSPTLRRIWATAYREDYPAEAEPHGFVTLTDLRRMAEALALGPHDTFADVGCGRGGPGLWIARQTGASFIVCGQKTQIVLFPCGYSVPSSGFSS